MDQRLIQQQSQKLILSPQMRQYLRMLQMPVIELQQAIDQEMTANPVLEDQREDRRLSERNTEDSGATNSERSSPVSEASNGEIRIGETFDRLTQLDEISQDSYEYRDVSYKAAKDLQKGKDFQESILTKPEGLSDYLAWQIRFISLTEQESKIALEIIGNINEDGYLGASLEEIAEAVSCELASVERVLGKLQTLDPPGICARNLQEALLLQLKRQGDSTHIAQRVVSEYLVLLEKRDWNQISKLMGVSLDVIKSAVTQITRLEPRPGRTFYVEEPTAVVPDATIYFDEDDNLKVEVHDEPIPSLRISPYYKRLLRDKNSNKETKLFLKEKIEAAYNLIKSLQLRKSTIREITEAIVKEQKDFFTYGFAQLKPLRLKDIADKLGIHESTVSRALQGKYVSTPQGTMPYKNFFSAKLETEDGENESQKSIMERIKNMVGKEDPKHPMSDETIVAELTAQGVKIARRTVAKYRDLLKILPSHLRRQR